MKLKTLMNVLQFVGVVLIFNATFQDNNSYEEQVVASVGGVLLIGIPALINYYYSRKQQKNSKKQQKTAKKQQKQ